MGYYIEGPVHGKLQHICEKYKGIQIPKPYDFSVVPKDSALICVVNNGPFEAAAYCYNEQEFLAFKNDGTRPKKWIIVKNKKIIENDSGYKQ